jgi:hypothetical protein
LLFACGWIQTWGDAYCVSLQSCDGNSLLFLPKFVDLVEMPFSSASLLRREKFSDMIAHNINGKELMEMLYGRFFFNMTSSVRIASVFSFHFYLAVTS